MPLNPGKNLAHYRLIDRLGAGGMGEVYLAEDTRLRRRVALKVLPPAMAADAERRMRFEREALAVAGLNHPNIVTLHSVEEVDGIHFLTMEHVEGPTLTELIPQEGMPLQRIFEIAIPLADAVAMAHERGITHRDLKPDNVMVAEGGRVKVLDFGLAKLREKPVGDDKTQLATATATQEGKILGTVNYMSPEQAEGKPVAPPSDVFSLGVILYEMATGKKPFQGDTPISTLSAILRVAPVPVRSLNQALPHHLSRIIKRCLAKDATRRYPSAAELRNELEVLREEVESGEVVDGPSGVAAPAAGRGVPKGWAVAVGVLAVAALALLFWGLRGRAPVESPQAPLAQMQFSQLTYGAGVESFPSLSPDGDFLLYTAEVEGTQHIFLQRVGGRNPINLTEDSSEDNLHPAFSPDGKFIAFRSEREGGGIFVMGATGESVRRLTDFGYNPAWSPDGKEIVFATEGPISPLSRDITSPLWVAEVASGEVRKVFDGDAVQPSWSPHGDWIVFWTNHPDEEEAGQRDIQAVRPDGSERVDITRDVPVDWNPVWSPDGRYVYFASDRGGSMNLWRIPMEEKSGTILGEPESLTTPSHWSGPFALSGGGNQIAYSALDLRMNITKAAFDRATIAVGAEVPITRGTLQLIDIDVSPDGEWIVSRSYGRKEDLYLVRSDGTGLRRLTDDLYKNRGPAWSPDGKSIAFYSNRGGNYEIWSIRHDGSDLRRILEAKGTDVFWPRWSPDGKRLAAYSSNGRTYVLEPGGDPVLLQTLEPLPLVDVEKGEGFSGNAWSPDGKHLAGNVVRTDGVGTRKMAIYSFETGAYELQSDEQSIYDNFAWLEDGRHAIVESSRRLMLLDTTTGNETTIPGISLGGFQGGSIDLSKDGKTLFFITGSSEADIWLATLQ